MSKLHVMTAEQLAEHDQALANKVVDELWRYLDAHPEETTVELTSVVRDSAGKIVKASGRRSRPPRPTVTVGAPGAARATT